MEKQPLAVKIRPQHLSDIVGQQHLVGEGKLLRRMIDEDQITSIIFWGPPGVGKTTLAHVIAENTQSDFVFFSAVTQGIADVRKIVAKAQKNLETLQQRTILFCDEIHRFNKAQQDAFLPHVESGMIILVGATTENPSFSITSALLSRSHVFQLSALSHEELIQLAERIAEANGWTFEDDCVSLLASAADGDARSLVNSLELSAKLCQGHITHDILQEIFQTKVLGYDRNGDEHYAVISAFIKSIRGSDPSAAVYWLARMIDAGEDPVFIARRLVISASEDIGNADPQALSMAVATQQAVHLIGMPEARITLAQCTTYLATTAKSASAYLGIKDALREVRQTGTLAVPAHIRNAPTELMSKAGFKKDYKYAHEYEDNYVEQTYLPEEIQGKSFYSPTQNGFEVKFYDILKTRQQQSLVSPKKTAPAEVLSAPAGKKCTPTLLSPRKKL